MDQSPDTDKPLSMILGDHAYPDPIFAAADRNGLLMPGEREVSFRRRLAKLVSYLPFASSADSITMPTSRRASTA